MSDQAIKKVLPSSQFLDLCQETETQTLLLRG